MVVIENTITHLIASPLQRIQDIQDEIAVLNELYDHMMLGCEPTANYVLDEIADLMVELAEIKNLAN